MKTANEAEVLHVCAAVEASLLLLSKFAIPAGDEIPKRECTPLTDSRHLWTDAPKLVRAIKYAEATLFPAR